MYDISFKKIKTAITLNQAIYWIGAPASFPGGFISSPAAISAGGNIVAPGQVPVDGVHHTPAGVSDNLNNLVAVSGSFLWWWCKCPFCWPQ